MSESSPFDFSVLDTTYDNTLVQTLPHMATTVSTGFIIGISMGHAVAVVSTCFRLVLKMIRKSLWWHDFWAMLSLVLLVLQWISAIDASNPQSMFNFCREPERKNACLIMMQAENAKTWIVSYQAASLTSLWSSRLSLAAAVIRLYPQGTPAHHFCKFVAVLFGTAAICLISYKAVGCYFNDVKEIELCGFDTTIMAALETSCDIIADLWLVNALMYRICGVELTSRSYVIKKLIVVSSMSILLASCTSIVHSVLVLLQQNKASFIARCAQCSTWLFVCNLPVLVTFLYRMIRGRVKKATNRKREIVTRQRIKPCPRGSLKLAWVWMKNRGTGEAHVKPHDRPSSHHCPMVPIPQMRRSGDSLMPIARNLSHTSTFPNLQIHHWHLESVDGQAVAPSLHIQTGNDDSAIVTETRGSDDAMDSYELCDIESAKQPEGEGNLYAPSVAARREEEETMRSFDVAIFSIDDDTSYYGNREHSHSGTD